MSVHDLPVPPIPGAGDTAALKRHAEARCADCGELQSVPGIPGLCGAWHVPRPASATAPSSDDNPHKLVARYRKARKCADVLRQYVPGESEENVAKFGTDPLARAFVAQLAGVRTPSEVTWPLVVELYAEGR